MQLYTQVRIFFEESGKRTLCWKANAMPERFPAAHDSNHVLSRDGFIRVIFCACMLTLLFSLPGIMFAETIVSGEVSGVWNVEGSPYIVIDTLFVPEGDTLQIRPGVVVEFQDQSETIKTPFVVNGCLLANGNENDSIRFLSDSEWAFQGFSLQSSENRSQFAFVVIDSALFPFQVDSSAFSIRHSRVITTGRYAVNSWMGGPDSVETTLWQGDVLREMEIRLEYGGSGHIEANTGEDVKVVILNCDTSLVVGNDVHELEILFTNVAVLRNTAYLISVTEGNFIIAYNVSDRDIRTSGASGRIVGNHNKILHISNHVLNYVEVDSNIIILNEGNEAVLIAEGTTVLTNNVIVGDNKAIMISSGTLSCINNTILFRNYGIYGNSNLIMDQITNNIFMGDGVDCIGIRRSTAVEPVSAQYNCFWNVTAATDNFDLDETNLDANPFLEGGDPYDYHLQANSPCIDAGDPDSEDDPDGTRADIGCYYYDQSSDNPPVQTIPEEVFAQTGQLLRIQITATDDNGPFSFTFPDLPEWLSEEDELDWVSDTTAVSGTVPEDAEDFSFTVIVEDGEGQTDSSIVTVDVDQRSLLSGEISGVLHIEDSPFYVIGDIVVPEGDSLVIEPGCELRFRYVEDQEQLIGLDVYGRLIAEGTVEDSICFTSELEESDYALWNGISFLDSHFVNYISYSDIEKANEAVKLDSASILNLRHSRLFDNYMSVYLLNSSQAQIDSCLFVSQVPEFIMYVFLNASDIEITNSVFWNQYEESPNSSSIWCILNSTALIQDNDFYNCEGVRLDESSHGEIFRNRFFNVPLGICCTNFSSGYVANNLFENHDWEEADGVWVTPDLEVLFTNNVFTGFECGVDIFGLSEGENSVQFFNNLFMNDSIAIFNRAIDDTPILYQYNCFWENDTNNVNLPWNILNIIMNPLLEDTLHFRLTDDSPLINAGHPDNAYYDCDSTRNDIGLWGGPRGASYEYPTSVREFNPCHASEFRMLEPYPNPFNAVTNIVFTVPERMDIKLNVYNILGRLVQASMLRNLEQGTHRIPLNLTGQSSGVLFVEIKSDQEIHRKRIVLIR